MISLNLLLQILLKGLLPLSVAGGGIAGLVYQFSPSSASKGELELLEEALKDIDYPIGDNEFLLEKVKDLASKLKAKKSIIKELENSLEEANTTKQELEKDIKEKEAQASDLEKEIANTTKELEQTQKDRDNTNNKKVESEKKRDAKKAALDNTNNTINELRTKKTTHTQGIATFTKRHKEQKAKYDQFAVEIEKQNKYNEYISSYLGYRRSKNIWSYDGSGWAINSEDFSYDPAVLEKNLLKRRLQTNEVMTAQKNVDLDIKLSDYWINDHQQELEKTSNYLTHHESKVQELTKEIGATEEEIKKLTSELTTLDTSISQVDSTLKTKTSTKEQLTVQITTSKVSLEEKTTLLTTKTPDLIKEQADLARLEALSKQVLERNSDNTVIQTTLKPNTES